MHPAFCFLFSFSLADATADAARLTRHLSEAASKINRAAPPNICRRRDAKCPVYFAYCLAEETESGRDMALNVIDVVAKALVIFPSCTPRNR